MVVSKINSKHQTGWNRMLGCILLLAVAGIPITGSAQPVIPKADYLPNLISTFPYLSNTLPYEGESFMLSVDIFNVGDNAANPSRFRVYLSQDNDGDVSDDYEITPTDNQVPSLDAGTSSRFSWRFNFPNLSDDPIYTVWIKVQVDSSGQVVEKDEFNLFTCNQFLKVTSVGFPNLAVSSVTVKSNTAAEETPFYVDVKVSNVGTSSAGSSLAQLFLTLDFNEDLSDDYQVLPDNFIPALNEGQSAKIRWEFNFPDLSNKVTYGVKAIIVLDPNNLVQEEDENNLFMAPQMITVLSPDIRIAPLTVFVNESKSDSFELNEGPSAEGPVWNPGKPLQNVGNVLPDQIVVRFNTETTAKLLAGRLANPNTKSVDWQSDPVSLGIPALPGAVLGVRPLASAENAALKAAEKDPTVAKALSQKNAMDTITQGLAEQAIKDAMVESGPIGLFNIKVEAGSDLSAICSELMNRSDVLYAHPSKIMKPLATPNDPLFSRQWNLSKYGMSSAWDFVSNTPAGVRACVIDTGVRITHDDLGGRTVAAKDIYLDNGNAYANGDPNDDDPDGHGTACAGIIAAVRNNAAQIAGMAPVLIIPVNAAVETPFGIGIANYWDGIYWAVDNGATVISCSFGGEGEPLQAEIDSINYAVRQDVLVVVAAGNDNTDVSTFYPANFDKVFTVGAVDNDNERVRTPKWWWGSNYGIALDICAYGQGWVGSFEDSIVTLSNESNTAINKDFNGTSSACPQVAGLCALLKHTNPNLTGSQIRSIIQKTARDLVGLPNEDKVGWDQYHGYGLIDPVAAVIAAYGGSYGRFTIYNDGLPPLQVLSILPQVPTAWLRIPNETPFTIPGGGSAMVNVLIDFSRAYPGTSRMRLLVTSNDPDESPYPGGVEVLINKTSSLTLEPTRTPRPTATPTLGGLLSVKSDNLLMLIQAVKSRDPRFRTLYDMNADSQINYRDLFEYSLHWGK